MREKEAAHKQQEAVAPYNSDLRVPRAGVALERGKPVIVYVNRVHHDRI